MIQIKNDNLSFKEPDIPGWFSISELNLLYESVIFINAKKSIEIGTFMGRSACAICSAKKNLGGERILTCVDTFASPVNKEYFERDFMTTMMNRFPNVRQVYSNYIKYPTTLDCFNLTQVRYPFMKDFVKTIKGDSRTLKLAHDKFDFALIDGDHTYEGVKNDFLKISPLVRDGGIICFHDNSKSFPGVQKFISEVNNYKEMILIGVAGTAVAFLYTSQ